MKLSTVEYGRTALLGEPGEDYGRLILDVSEDGPEMSQVWRVGGLWN